MSKGLLLLSGDDLAACDALPSNEERASLFTSLIKAFNLDRELERIPFKRATRADLEKFHTREFVDAVFRDESDSEDELESHGFWYDCPQFPLMIPYIRATAGSTLSCASWMIDQLPESAVAVNFYGGRHHAKRDKASGFCYVNDIVLGILRLRSHFGKVMYIDFDLHHGDGVASAFQFSSNVLTCSLHRYDVGFFPGTGSLDDVGKGAGTNYNVNIPLERGLSDERLKEVKSRILVPLIEKYNPQCLVLQCGADGLYKDDHREWNLTAKGLAECIYDVIDRSGKPTLVLGGGGYNHIETAKCWTYLVKLIAGNKDKWDYVPEHEKIDLYTDFDNRGDTNYEFWKGEPSKQIDRNSIDHIVEEIMSRPIS